MMSWKVYIQFALLALLFNSCYDKDEVAVFEPISHPVDNPSSPEKIKLGRDLFFDPRLSRDSSISCASCHLPELAFTDGRSVSIGVEGRQSERNAPSILNAGYLKRLMFDAHVESLEMQSIVPIQEEVEMDMRMSDLISRLSLDEGYQKAAQVIFNRDFDAFVLTRAIAAYERSLVSNNSPFDRFYYHDEEDAISVSQKKGWKLFSEKLYCTKCHPEPYFTTFKAENNGLYADYSSDQGRFRIHHDSSEIGMFKVPSLRNIVLTAPYMHDGSLETLEEVLDHYAKGGSGHYLQDSNIQSFELSYREKNDLINFFKSLTDTSYMVDY